MFALRETLVSTTDLKDGVPRDAAIARVDGAMVAQSMAPWSPSRYGTAPRPPRRH